MRLVQAKVLLRLLGDACALAGQDRRVAVRLLCPFVQVFLQLVTTHHHQGALQVVGNTCLIGAALDEAGLQSAQVRRDSHADELVFAKMNRQFIGLEAEKLGQQRPTIFKVADQYVVNIDVGSTTTGFKLFSRTPGLLAVVGIKRLVTVTAQFIEQHEQPAVIRLVTVRRLETCLGGRALEPFDKALLLARRVATDQGIDAMVPAGDLSMELARGQIPVVQQVKRSVHGTTMADHQQVRPIGFTPGAGHRCLVIERQYLTVIHHQHFDSGIVVEEQSAVAAMDVIQRQLAHAIEPQGRDPQLECRGRPTGDRQLRGTQQCQGVATVTRATLDG
ncbi:hypothetical protein D3C80_1259290 [compost metagenome]